MTADDINKLQVIQNSLNRLLTGARKGNTHQGPLGKDGHDVNHADGGVRHTNNGAQGDTAKKLEVVHGSEFGSRAWG